MLCPETKPVSQKSLSGKYKILLNTENSMSQMLEINASGNIGFLVLNTSKNGNVYQMEVLRTNKSKPIAYARIKIFLGRVSPETKKEVIEGLKPFGKILLDRNMETEREIKNIFSAKTSAELKKLMKTNKKLLFGRAYLIKSNGKVLAEVTEILA